MTDHQLNLLDARLKRAEAHATQTGNTWLRDVMRRHRRRAAEDATRSSDQQLPAHYAHARASTARRTQEVSQ